MFLTKIRKIKDTVNNDNSIDVGSFYKKEPTSEVKNNKNKFILIIKLIAIILLLLLVYTSIKNLLFEKEHNEKIVKTATASLVDPHIKKDINSNTKNKIIALNKTYPFVMPSSDLFDDNTNATPMQQGQSRNVTMPSIPNVQYNQQVDRATLPAFPGGSVQTSSTIKPQRIEGILTNNDGKNAAIVNGKVVTEGDVLNGNSISHIDNGGITFENGNKISYGIH